MTSSLIRLLHLALCALAFALAPASAASFDYAAPPAALRPFYTRLIQFGYLTVPENRARPNGRTIRIAALILKAVHPAPGALPFFFLNGRPGGSCTAFGEKFPLFAAIQQRRDIVLIDQRGVGFSQPYLGLTADNDRELRAFRAAFRARGIDLSAYNTTENAAAPTRRPVYSLASLRRNDFYLTPARSEDAPTALEADAIPSIPLP